MSAFDFTPINQEEVKAASFTFGLSSTQPKQGNEFNSIFSGIEPWKSSGDKAASGSSEGAAKGRHRTAKAHLNLGSMRKA